MEFGSLDGREDGEYNGINFVVIREIFAMQDAFCFEAGPFGGLYLPHLATQ